MILWTCDILKKVWNFWNFEVLVQIQLQVRADCLDHGFDQHFDHPLTVKSLSTSSGDFLSQKLDVEAFLCVLRSFVHELFEFLSLKMIMHWFKILTFWKKFEISEILKFWFRSSCRSGRSGGGFDQNFDRENLILWTVGCLLHHLTWSYALATFWKKFEISEILVGSRGRSQLSAGSRFWSQFWSSVDGKINAYLFWNFLVSKTRCRCVFWSFVHDLFKISQSQNHYALI